jgi:hypothetical protein
MPESKNTRKAVIRIEVEYCSQCPKARLSETYYNPEFDEEDQDIFCEELGKTVHKALKWNEIKTRHQCAKPEYDNSLDYVPSDCPYLAKESQKETKQ